MARPRLDISDEERRARAVLRAKLWAMRNPERALESKKTYQNKNRESIRARKRQQYLANREDRLKKFKEYRRTHSKEVVECTKRWVANNKEKSNELKRVWVKRNPEKIEKMKPAKLAKSREWKKNNPEKNRLIIHNWRKKNVDKVNKTRTGYATLKANAPGSYTKQDILSIFKNQHGLCYYCPKEIKWPDSKTHVEHKTPLSRGGTNEKENICLACEFCNDSKGYRTEAEFVAGTYVPRSVLQKV